MANPTLNSFISPNYFNTEKTVNPLYSAILAGSTYVPPTFSGISGAASTDPGGLFGWLVYSRTALSNPTKGTTTQSYIVYTNPSDFVNDLNNLGGITSCLVASTNGGGTYSFFTYSSTDITPLTNGNDFLYALTYLAYGGVLVIAGNTAGLISYEADTSNKIEVLIGQTANAMAARYVEETPQVFGIFSSVNNGAGYTAQNFDTLFSSSALVPFTAGATVSDRIFNVGGQIQKSKIPMTSLFTGTYLTYTLSAVSEAAGAFTRAKDKRNIYISVGGTDMSVPLNGTIKLPIFWSDTSSKNIYKKNRVNFYSKTGSSYFLGLDIVGATSGSSSSYTTNERIGPSKLKQDIETQVGAILLKYVFNVNNSSTRSSVSSEVTQYIFGLNQFLDPNFTQITCDSSNNTDNSATLKVDITIKPLISTEEYSLSVTATAS
jgi:hypothetical protein